jgi:membrane protein YdbS with pleckstrin-like domain
MVNFTNTQINPEELPALQTLDLLPLEGKYLKVMYINTLSTLIIPAGYITSLFVFELYTNLWIAIPLGIIAVLITSINFLLVKPSFKVKKFAIREQDIIYQSGLLFRSLTVTPYSRVQHCEINRGPLSRLLGLSELNIFTAGGSASDIRIPGLDEHTAKQLCQYVLQKIKHTDEEE